MNETPTSAKLAFLRKFGPIDEAISQARHFPLGIVTAWLAMESDYGTSELAAKYNNLGGIKAGPTWKAEKRPYVDLPTHENEGQRGHGAAGDLITSSFRVYPDWQASAEDALKVLEGDFHGAPYLARLSQGDVAGFLRGIGASGYSTASNYAGRIENFMRDIAALA